MLRKIKIFFLVAGSVALSILYALLQKSKANRMADKLAITKHSIDAQTEATKALVNGIADEHATMVEPVPANKSEHFK